jgi:membrane-associated PAP2 superfamily phosphatase
VLGFSGLVCAVIGCWFRRSATWAKVGLFLALSLALGPGLLVNGLLKPHWNRPRPNQIRQFGGQFDFVNVLGRISYEQARSFPCGHASMGFYLMAPAFVLYRRNWRLAFVFIMLGLVAGGVIGFGRIAQGRHFLSDVIWSAATVYVTGLFLCILFGFHRRLSREASRLPFKGLGGFAD